MTDNKKSSPFEVLTWTPVAIWSFNVPHKECLICRCMLTTKCATCLESKNMLTEACAVSKGKCGHAYHFHCIRKSIASGNNMCPVCCIVWNAETENLDSRVPQKKKSIIAPKKGAAPAA
jgi:E3 ubiquitin-protein ligase RBX1